MTQSKNRQGRSHSRREKRSIIRDGSPPASRTRSSKVVVNSAEINRHRDSEEGGTMIADIFPSTLLDAAVALNDLIYIGCEKMECREHEDGCGYILPKNSLDETLETNSLADSSDYRGTQSENSIPNVWTGISSITSLNLQYNGEQKLNDTPAHLPPSGELLSSLLSVPAQLSFSQGRLGSRKIDTLVKSPKLSTRDSRNKHKTQPEVRQEKTLEDDSVFHNNGKQNDTCNLTKRHSKSLYDRCERIEVLPITEESDSIETQSRHLKLGDKANELYDPQVARTNNTENSVKLMPSDEIKPNISQISKSSSRQLEERRKPSESSVRSMTRSLSKYIRPTKIENIEPPFQPSILDKKKSTNVSGCTSGHSDERPKPSENSIRSMTRSLSKYVRPTKIENVEPPFQPSVLDKKESTNVSGCTSRQLEERRKPSENSIRSMTRSLSKYVRPTKIENVEPPFQPSVLDKKESTNVSGCTNRSSRSCVFDKQESAKNESNHSGRLFRLSILDRNEQSSDKEEIEYSGRSNRSSIFDRRRSIKMKNDDSDRSHRTRILNRNKTPKDYNYSDRIGRRSVRFGPEEEYSKKEAEGSAHSSRLANLDRKESATKDNDLSGRSFRTAILGRSRSKSVSRRDDSNVDRAASRPKRSKSRSKNNRRKSSLMSRLRGRSPSNRTRDKKTTRNEKGKIEEDACSKKEQEIDPSIPILEYTTSESDKENDENDDENENIKKQESIQSPQNICSDTKKEETGTRALASSNHELKSEHKRRRKTGKVFFLSSKFESNQKIEDDIKQKVETKNESSIINSPTHSTRLLSSAEEELIYHILLAPNEDGQEIAIQDDNYYYDDPAQVHSLLTMPSFSTATISTDTGINSNNEIYQSQKGIVPHGRYHPYLLV